MPLPILFREGTTGNNIMNMGMILKLAAPGVKCAKKPGRFLGGKGVEKPLTYPMLVRKGINAKL
jgi:hypothetical protein